VTQEISSSDETVTFGQKLGWTDVLVHPRSVDKHLNVYAVQNGIGRSNDTAGLPIQKLPFVCSRICSESSANAFFAKKTTHWAAPSLAAGAALAIVSNSAVRIQAAPLIAAYLEAEGGFVVSADRNAYSHYDANRQALRRRNLPASAGEIVQKLLDVCGLSGQVQVSIHRGRKKGAADCRRSVIIIPKIGCAEPEVARRLLAELTLGRSTGKRRELSTPVEWSRWQRLARRFDLSESTFDNFVENYMRKHITEDMFNPAISLDKAVSLVGEKKYDGAYSATLSAEIANMYNAGFQCHYRTAQRSARMFGIGSGIQFMPGRLRREIFPHFIELDFANMHLALANSKLNIGLDLSLSFWTQLFDEQQVVLKDISDSLEQPTAARFSQLFSRYPEIFSGLNGFTFDQKYATESFLKEFNKTATYAVLFGKSASAQISETAKAIRSAGADYDFSLVLARLICRSELIVKISNHIADYCDKNDIDAGSLSAEFQKSEVKYVKTLYDLAGEAGVNQARILIHSHDGVSMQFADVRAARRFFARIDETLHADLAADGICTKIEAKTADGKKIDLSCIKSTDIIGFGKIKTAPVGISSKKRLPLVSLLVCHLGKWTLSTGPP